MGYYQVGITVTGVRSAHNSLQDRLDQTTWQYLADRIRQLVESIPEAERLRIEVRGPEE